MTTAGIVLAAGQSRRFGMHNKLLANFRGEALARHAARAMASTGFEHIIAVTSDHAIQALFGGFEIVRVQAGADQSTSLRAGVARANSLNAARVVIALADMPLVDPQTIKAIDQLCTVQGLSACTDGSKIVPPAGFIREHFEELSTIEGDSGARTLLQSLQRDSLLKCSPKILLDIDTIDELSL